MAKKIVLANQKGGVAKTSSCVILASALLRMGHKVLVVDIDPQADASDFLGIDTDSEDVSSIYEVLKGSVDVDGAIVRDTFAGDLLVGSEDMFTAELEFNRTGKELMLRRVLDKVSDRYDYILIDTPPNLGWCTVNALTAADWLVIPSNPSRWSSKAMKALRKTIDMVTEYTNPDLKIAGVFITNMDMRANNTRTNVDLAALVADNYGYHLFSTSVHRGCKIEEAQTEQVDVFEVSPQSKPAKDYEALAQELIGRIR